LPRLLAHLTTFLPEELRRAAWSLKQLHTERDRTTIVAGPTGTITVATAGTEEALIARLRTVDVEPATRIEVVQRYRSSIERFTILPLPLDPFDLPGVPARIRTNQPATFDNEVTGMLHQAGLPTEAWQWVLLGLRHADQEPGPLVTCRVLPGLLPIVANGSPSDPAHKDTTYDVTVVRI
jgi:hypothetical protein